MEGLSDGFDERTAYGAPPSSLPPPSSCRRRHRHSSAAPHPSPTPTPYPGARPPAGYIDGIDDPSMGWARYAQTVRIFVLNSGLFFMRASPRAVRFAFPSFSSSSSFALSRARLPPVRL